MFELTEAVAGTAGQGLSDQELEDEICAHGARLAAGECHLVMLVAEMDRNNAGGSRLVQQMIPNRRHLGATWGYQYDILLEWTC